MARRPLTDEQRNILQQERSNRRLLAEASERATANEAMKTRELASREATHRQSRLSTESGLAGQRSSRELRSTIIQTATPSSNSNIIMVTLFVMFGLIIVYDLVTMGEAVGGFLGGLSNWIATLSTNTPLFVNKAAATTTTTATKSSATVSPSSLAAGRSVSAQGNA